MAYVLVAILGRSPVVRAALPEAPIVELEQGFALVPRPPETPGGSVVGRWWWLTADGERRVSTASARGPLAYVEAHFHGGTGVQSAAIWSDRVLVLGPIHTKNHPAEEGPAYELATEDMAIDRALRWLGAHRRGTEPMDDEFAAVGLDRHRSIEDWLAAVN